MSGLGGQAILPAAAVQAALSDKRILLIEERRLSRNCSSVRGEIGSVFCFFLDYWAAATGGRLPTS
jgi:hypothetical protein